MRKVGKYSMCESMTLLGFECKADGFVTVVRLIAMLVMDLGLMIGAATQLRRE